jgi:hypothetical protein
MSSTNHSQLGFLTDVNGKEVLYMLRKGDSSGTKWVQDEGTGTRVYGHGMRQKFSFSLGQYATVLQAEVYAIKACVADNSKRGYLKRNTYILSDRQAAIKPLDK